MTKTALYACILFLSAFCVADDRIPTNSKNSASSKIEVASPLATEQYHELVDFITQFSDKQKNLSQQIAQARGEEKISLKLRLFQKQTEHIDHIDKLSKLLINTEASDNEMSPLIQPVKKHLMQLGPKVYQFIQAQQNNFRLNKNGIDELSVDFSLLLSNHLAYNDKALSILSNHIDNLNNLNLNNKHSTDYLNRALLNRIESLAGQLQINNSRHKALTEQAEINSSDKELKRKLTISQQKLELITASFKKTIKLMDNAGISTTEYQRILIESTGKITSDILDEGVLNQLLQRWSKSIVAAIKLKGIDFLFNALIFVFIIVAFYLLSIFIEKVLRFGFSQRKNHSTLLKNMLTSLISRSLLIAGILIALSQLGISIEHLLAGIGIAGFIIGFALQDILSNFASGMMILIYRPYDVGDFIEVSGVFGKVSSMSLVSSTIHTIDNQTLVIPNNRIWGDVIKNITEQKTRRIDIEFSVSLDQNVDEIIDLLKDICNNNKLILSEPKTLVHLNKITNNAQVFIVRPWVETQNYWPVHWELNEEVKRQFDQNKIKYPAYQNEITLRDQTN